MTPTTLLDTPPVRQWLRLLNRRGEAHGVVLAEALVKHGISDGSRDATIILDRLEQANIIARLGEKPQPTVTQQWGGVGGHPPAASSRPTAPSVCWVFYPQDIVPGFTFPDSITEWVETREKVIREAQKG